MPLGGPWGRPRSLFGVFPVTVVIFKGPLGAPTGVFEGWRSHFCVFPVAHPDDSLFRHGMMDGKDYTYRISWFNIILTFIAFIGLGWYTRLEY